MWVHLKNQCICYKKGYCNICTLVHVLFSFKDNCPLHLPLYQDGSCYSTLTANQTGTGVASYNHGKRVQQSWVGRIQYRLFFPLEPHLPHDPEIKFAIDLHWSTLFFTQSGVNSVWNAHNCHLGEVCSRMWCIDCHVGLGLNFIRFCQTDGFHMLPSKAQLG